MPEWLDPRSPAPRARVVGAQEERARAATDMRAPPRHVIDIIYISGWRAALGGVPTSELSLAKSIPTNLLCLVGLIKMHGRDPSQVSTTNRDLGILL